MAIPLAVALIPAAMQAGTGLYQMIKGQNDASKLNRPTYQIPEEIKSKLTLAQQRSLEGMPDASKKLFIDNMQRSSAFGLRNLSSRQAGLAGIPELVQGQTDQGRQMAVQDAQARLVNEQNLGTVQSEMAGYRDKEFDVNQLTPYTQKAQAAQALIGAGLQNIGGAVQGAGTAVGQKLYADALKTPTTPTTTPTTPTAAITPGTTGGYGSGSAVGTSGLMGMGGQPASQAAQTPILPQAPAYVDPSVAGPNAVSPFAMTQTDPGATINVPSGARMQIGSQPVVPYGQAPAQTNPFANQSGFPLATTDQSPMMTQQTGLIKQNLRLKYPNATEEQIDQILQNIPRY